MYRLRNEVMNYAWGSHSAIAGLEGRAPSSKPEAEVWMGAHAKASSAVLTDQGPLALTNLIAQEPATWLGPHVSEKFGPTLPFLFKVLAAASPLSLQAHPSIAQARAGYDAEDAKGIPLDAPHRNYRDRNHKPELICALTRFEALCGFRARDTAIALFHEINRPALIHAVAPLFQESLNEEAALRATFAGLMRLPKTEQQLLCREALAALPTEPSPFASSFRWARRLGELYPGDIGMVVSLLLNQVTLQPGQALYLPAGNLHAYLEGLGVELMANSDNVLRGGCTPKHVDVEELLRVLSFRGGPIPVINPSPSGDVAIQRYVTEAEEFELSRVRVRGELTMPAHPGPRIALVTEGQATLTGADVAQTFATGQSAYVLPGETVYVQGDGVLFLAAVGSVKSPHGLM